MLNYFVYVLFRFGFAMHYQYFPVAVLGSIGLHHPSGIIDEGVYRRGSSIFRGP